MVDHETQKLLGRLVSETTREFERLLGPPDTLVSLLSYSVLIDDQTLESRLTKLPMLREAMQANSELASIYIGYPNGEFFQFRKMGSQEDRRGFGAPDETSWTVQSIDRQEGKPTMKQFLFYDRDLILLGTKEWESNYDPRQRSWYQQAVDSIETVRSSPYVFFTDKKVGMTFARNARGKRTVAGADLRLETLSPMLQEYKITPRSEVVLFGADGRLIAHEDNKRMLGQIDSDPDQLVRRKIDQMDAPALDALNEAWHDQGSGTTGRLDFDAGNEPWVATVQQLSIKNGPPIFFGMAIPTLELMSEVRHIRNQTALLALALVLILIPITMTMARSIAKPISQLADEADAVRHFNFSDKKRIRSIITEVDDLAGSMLFMQKTISDFLLLIESQNREKNFDSLLEGISNDVRRAAGCDGVLICLLDHSQGALCPDAYCDAQQCGRDLELPNFSLDKDLPIVAAVTNNETTRWELSRDKDKELYTFLGDPVENTTIWCQPLQDRQNNSMGVIGMVFHGDTGTDSAELQDRLLFVNRLSGLAGVTLETKQLIKKQKELFEAFIKLIAGAIDAKSPYTGGHCQRVPVIAKMLAKAACDSQEGPLADFDLTEEQWEELHVAAWLHDCGKVTTPEFVVDKSTKLETIYDRIHEVRMRFEVLKRDAEISCWQTVAEGGEREELLSDLHTTLDALDEDYRFIARCNEGGEFLAEEAIARITSIAEKTWLRTCDDRIGISWDEGKRKERTPTQELPVEERLLSDKEEHLFIRGEADRMKPDNPWGFKIDEPEHLYNRGEIHNLKVQRGTLSQEERFKINDHIVQTIKMLKELPYPHHLRGVPEIAGGHHETMTGTGYPRQLTGDQMSITARIMVIADVYEALTAADRPYKKAKKLSDAIRIMASMQKGDHFDTDLYNLFLTSGIYRQYGEQYLNPDQVDEVNIEQYVNV